MDSVSVLIDEQAVPHGSSRLATLEPISVRSGLSESLTGQQVGPDEQQPPPHESDAQEGDAENQVRVDAEPVEGSEIDAASRVQMEDSTGREHDGLCHADYLRRGIHRPTWSVRTQNEKPGGRSPGGFGPVVPNSLPDGSCGAEDIYLDERDRANVH